MAWNQIKTLLSWSEVIQEWVVVTEVEAEAEVVHKGTQWRCSRDMIITRMANWTQMSSLTCVDLLLHLLLVVTARKPSKVLIDTHHSVS